MFKENPDCPRIDNTTRTTIALLTLIIFSVISVVGYWLNSLQLHSQVEQEMQARLEIQAEQQVSRKERQELRDRVIRLETLLKSEH